MHQTSNNRYNPNGYGSLRVTPIACGLEMPKRHGKITAFLSICSFLIRPFVVIYNKDWLKIRLIFNFYAHFFCKNDWNNFLLLNTNGPLINRLIKQQKTQFCSKSCLGTFGSSKVYNTLEFQELLPPLVRV